MFYYCFWVYGHQTVILVQLDAWQGDGAPQTLPLGERTGAHDETWKGWVGCPP